MTDTAPIAWIDLDIDDLLATLPVGAIIVLDWDLYDACDDEPCPTTWH